MTRILTGPADATRQPDRHGPSSRTISGAASIALTVGSRLIHAASQAVMLVLIARLGGIGDTAAFIWATALTAPIFMFANMNLREMISTETAHGQRFREYWTVRLISSGGGVAVLLAVVPFATRQADWLIVAVVAAGKALESMHDLIMGAYHRYEQVERAAVSLIARSCGGCLCLAATLMTMASLSAGLAAMILFQLVLMLVYDRRHVRRFQEDSTGADLSSVLKIMRVALPLGVVACLSSLAFNMPRYVVNQHLDDLSLAAFGCCASFLQVFTLTGVAAQLALSPQIASRNAHSRKSMNNMLWHHVAWVACVGVVVVVVSHLWGPKILGTIYGRQYASFGPVLAWLMVSGVFSAAKGFLATGFTTTRSTKSQAAFAGAQFSCSAAGCLWLVPRHGLIAAGYVVAASAAVSFTLHAIWTIASAREESRT